MQIITGSWINHDSPLVSYQTGIGKQYSGVAVGAVTALQVLADEVVTAAIGKLPYIGPVLSGGLTLYDVQQAFVEGLSPTTVLDDAAYSFDILIGTTIKFAFVKYSGALDEGNQILCYVGNEVDYTVYIDVPVFEIVNGERIMYRDTVEYSDSSTSYGYGYDDCRTIAATNFKTYKQGLTPENVYYHIVRIPMLLMDDVYNASIPYEFPYLS